MQLIRHPRNRGKGAAVRTAIAAATGEYAIIQDADLEYDPAELASLLAPIERGRATVVYGSRSFSAHSAYSFWFVVGNKLVTLWTNVLFNCYLSDMETCYKLMPLSVWRSLGLSSNGFDIEPEITAKLLRAGHRIYEVPISYAARGASRARSSPGATAWLRCGRSRACAPCRAAPGPKVRSASPRTAPARGEHPPPGRDRVAAGGTGRELRDLPRPAGTDVGRAGVIIGTAVALAALAWFPVAAAHLGARIHTDRKLSQTGGRTPGRPTSPGSCR